MDNNNSKSVFETLNAIDCSKHVEKKNGLSYLSWPWAWSMVKQNYPSANYTIRHWDEKPYLSDDNFGIMIETSVTIEGETQSMWLFVMDGTNKAMKAQPYTYQTKYGEKRVEAATMFDINTTIMRCLVKNLAMFGLGLYIYAGEDLPETDEQAAPAPAPKPKPQPKPQPKEQQTVDPKVLAGYIARLKTATTRQELEAAYKGLPADIQKNQMIVLTCKDIAGFIAQEQKEELPL